MSRITEVIKNKNKVEKLARNRRKADLKQLRINTAFKAKLYNELRVLDILLDDTDIEYVIVDIDNKHSVMFNGSIYSQEEMSGYILEQLAPNTFKVRKRFITL